MAAVDALEKAKKIKEGSFYQTMSCLVFSAFTVEAYLNHVGEQKIAYWNEIEKIEPMAKLKALHSVLKLPFDPSKRPVQTIQQLFKFRNFMAHGRTEKLTGRGTMKKSRPDPGKNLVETKWEKFCNEKEAERAVKDVKKLLETVCAAAGFDKAMFFSLGHASRVVGRPEP
jgi:hypothetical protein